jgi:hypothetical protein
MFLSCLETAIQVPKALPGHKQLRARFIAFVHRMVESLLAGVLPYLPAALQVGRGGGGRGEQTTAGEGCRGPRPRQRGWWEAAARQRARRRPACS